MVVLSVVFFLLAAVCAMLGVGGGIVYVPTLLLTGHDMHWSVTASLATILAGSSSAASVYLLRKEADLPLALLLEPATMLMAFVGGMLSAHVPSPLLQGLLGSVVLGGSYAMWKKKRLLTSKDGTHRWGTWTRVRDDATYHVWLPAVLPAVAAAGLLSGLVGVTGGFLKVPILVLLCGVPMHTAVATSTVMVVFTALGGLAGHVTQETVNWLVLIPLAIAVILGGQLGSRLVKKVEGATLRLVFAGLLALVGLRILILALW